MIKTKKDKSYPTTFKSKYFIKQVVDFVYKKYGSIKVGAGTIRGIYFSEHAILFDIELFMPTGTTIIKGVPQTNCWLGGVETSPISKNKSTK